ncbi:lysylphosphatidylglycerol synthase transmembrane domain-containing protein [Eggerthella sinensis]|uniref:lysylphosphatidylglycerol synthase transmembrane domain-containing protein n=1 Tax=Eggerthella sinensis TaxID=242230 RepID=UPI001D088B78|nr:lysylphosphatidylglycerol synthase transmembrane domain-containing protein [Eggerthella sinensis]MCB7039051.1 lysylphosphatidylglycerol synthase domain-containing protein [Eggerthella sinensis]
MKKALLLVIGIVAVCFLIANADYLASFLATLKTGALVPLVVATVLMLARHLVQAASYDAAFEAVGHKTGFWHNVVLIFSLVFINTFCLFSGATGVAFIIDDAHRTGADAGTSTSGAILSQIGYFAAILVISIIGFLTMLLSGSMNTLFLIGGLALAAVLAVLSSMFVVGYRKPRMLFRLFIGIEKLVNKMLGVAKKHLKPAWGRKMAGSFISSAGILAKNPQGTLVTVAYASFSAILNMACLVAIGYAFGFDNVAALVAAFAVAAISVILSPTPQGVGVVEAAIAAILTAHGCSLATATAIALVYRGIMFWVPFCIGALLLSQSGFFADKKSPTEEQRAKDTAWVLGTLVLIVGLVNMGLALIPQTFEPFMALTEWINMGGLLIGPALIVGSVVLIVLAVGLILRFRTAWALTLGVLVLLAGAEFLYVNTVQVAVAALVLLCLLFWKRDAFDRPIVPRDDAPRLVSEFHENLDRFHAWNEARRERAASGEGDDVRTGRGAALAARRAERRDQGRAKRKTGWEQRAEKGAEISRQAQREGILPFGEDVVVSPAGVAGLSVAESAPEKKESQ